MNSDTEIIQMALSTNFSNLIRCLLFIIVVLIILMNISSKLTGITVAGVFVIILAATIFGCCMMRLGKLTSAAKAKMNTIGEETFANVRTVKAFATEETEIKRFRECNMKVLYYGKWKAISIGIFSFFMTIIFWTSMGGICFYAYILY